MRTLRVKTMVKKIFIAFLLTVLISVGSGFIISPDTYLHSDFIILSIILSGIFTGIPNVVFLLLVHYLNVGREILSNVKKMILEIVVLNILGIAIHKILILFPPQYRYENAASVTTLKFYFNPTFEMLYAFVILLLVLLVIKKMQSAEKQT